MAAICKNGKKDKEKFVLLHKNQIDKSSDKTNYKEIQTTDNLNIIKVNDFFYIFHKLK